MKVLLQTASTEVVLRSDSMEVVLQKWFYGSRISTDCFLASGSTREAYFYRSGSRSGSSKVPQGSHLGCWSFTFVCISEDIEGHVAIC